jgi:hypothetical protein
MNVGISVIPKVRAVKGRQAPVMRRRAQQIVVEG